MVQRQEAALLAELLPEAVPLELRFHLELLVEYSHGVFWRYWFDRCVDLFCAALPENNNVHRLLGVVDDLLNV